MVLLDHLLCLALRRRGQDEKKKDLKTDWKTLDWTWLTTPGMAACQKKSNQDRTNIPQTNLNSFSKWKDPGTWQDHRSPESSRELQRGSVPGPCAALCSQRERKNGQLKADMTAEILNFSKDYQGGFIVCGLKFLQLPTKICVKPKLAQPCSNLILLVWDIYVTQDKVGLNNKHCAAGGLEASWWTCPTAATANANVRAKCYKSLH